MKTRQGFLVILLALSGLAAWAQRPDENKPAPATPPKAMPPGAASPPAQPASPQRPSGADVFAINLFSPEVVMMNQNAIGLREDQKAALKTEMFKNMPRVMDLLWKQRSASEKLGETIKPDHLDEAQVLAQLDALLKIENELKALQLSSLVRMKNILTPEQQAQLREIIHHTGPFPLFPSTPLPNGHGGMPGMGGPEMHGGKSGPGGPGGPGGSGGPGGPGGPAGPGGLGMPGGQGWPVGPGGPGGPAASHEPSTRVEGKP